MKSMSQIGWNRALAKTLAFLLVLACLSAGALVPSVTEAIPFSFPIRWITIPDSTFTEAQLAIKNDPTDGYVLTWDEDSGMFTWAAGGTGSGTIATVGAFVSDGLFSSDSTGTHVMMGINDNGVTSAKLAAGCLTSSKLDNTGTYGADNTDYVLCKDASGNMYWRKISDLIGGGE